MLGDIWTQKPTQIGLRPCPDFNNPHEVREWWRIWMTAEFIRPRRTLSVIGLHAPVLFIALRWTVHFNGNLFCDWNRILRLSPASGLVLLSTQLNLRQYLAELKQLWLPSSRLKVGSRMFDALQTCEFVVQMNYRQGHAVALESVFISIKRFRQESRHFPKCSVSDHFSVL